MGISFDRQLGIAGVLLALAGIGIPLVLPDARWVGWICLAAGAIGLALWLIAEIRSKIKSRLSWVLSTLIAITILGGLGLLYLKESKPRKMESHKSTTTITPSEPPPRTQPEDSDTSFSKKEAPQQAGPRPSTQSRIVSQSTSGSDSPNISGAGNRVTYGQPK